MTLVNAMPPRTATGVVRVGVDALSPSCPRESLPQQNAACAEVMPQTWLAVEPKLSVENRRPPGNSVGAVVDKGPGT
jgi:hypothetical protein